MIVTAQRSPARFEFVTLTVIFIKKFESLRLVDWINTHVCVWKTITGEVVFLKFAFSFVNEFLRKQLFWRIPKESWSLIKNSSQLSLNFLFNLEWRNLFSIFDQILKILGAVTGLLPASIYIIEVLFSFFYSDFMLNFLIQIEHIYNGRESLHLLIDS